ncbi:hypothetical protein BVC80_447g5 [Macleaya cordata]|uniref:Uncharacterized protein n=1 Tax=Macleaya cordata TaxID=56857 RepID=A0A200Q527_MACCD|nr:hypothetical protein BVC80_447g5 [Macleaya cordata]
MAPKNKNAVGTELKMTLLPFLGGSTETDCCDNGRAVNDIGSPILFNIIKCLNFYVVVDTPPLSLSLITTADRSMGAHVGSFSWVSNMATVLTLVFSVFLV